MKRGTVEQFSAEYGETKPRSECICTHTGDGAFSDHVDSIQAGHGRCKIKGCGCVKFSWMKHTDIFRAAIRRL